MCVVHLNVMQLFKTIRKFTHFCPVLLIVCFTGFFLDASALRAENGLERVSVQLDWKFQFEYAGFIAAVEKGFYNEAGLEVQLIEYQAGLDTVARVIEHEVNYGIHNSSLVITDGKIQPIILLATYYQRSPLVFVTAPEIKNPREMLGRSIMGTKDEFKYSSLALMLYHFGIDGSNSQILEHTFDVDQFIDGRVDVMSAFLSNQIFNLEQRKVAYNIIDPFDYGFFMSGVNMFTSREEALDHPDRTRRFVNATNRGWEYALAHPEEIIETILARYAPGKTREALQYEYEITEKLFLRDFYPIGAVNTELTMRAYKQLLDRHMIDDGQKLGPFIFEDFLQASETSTELSSAEMEYLFKKQEITFCSDPDWMPFEGIRNGKHIGIAADYLQVFQKELPVPLRLVPTTSWVQALEFARQRKCDVVSLASSSKEREEYLDFTSPHIVLPVVLATRQEEFFIDNFESIVHEKIGVVKGYSINATLRSKYPDGNFVEVGSLYEGLEMVEKGELFGYVDNLLPIADKVQKHFTGTLKISARLKENVALSIGTRNDEPILNAIFQKKVSAITPSQKQSFYNKWVPIREKAEFDYTKLWVGLSVVAFFLGLFAIRNLQLRRYNKLLGKMSITDKLTQVFNRFKLDEVLTNQQNLYERYGNDCGVIIVDIDFFKDINDTFGHQIGDSILVEFTGLLKQHIRTTDILGRWGGEEFLIISPSCSVLDTMRLAEKLRARIAGHTFCHGKQLTASLGVSSFDIGKTIKGTVSSADTALYEAKESGRNRTVTAKPVLYVER